MSCGSPTLLQEAFFLAEELRRLALRAKDGSIFWSDPRQPHSEQSTRPQIGPHLYDGTTGIALFLAAVEKAAGGGGTYRDTSLRAINTLRRRLSYLVANRTKSDQLNFKLGGLIGLGGGTFMALFAWDNGSASPLSSRKPMLLLH